MISILKYSIIFIIIFGSFRILSKLIPQLSIRRNIKVIVQRFLPLLEFVFWLIFVLWILQSEITKPLYFNAAIFGVSGLLLIFFGLFVMKDFMAGLILKTEYGLQKGDTFATEKFHGKILKLSFLYLELETGESEHTKIPYGKISGIEIKISNENSIYKKFSYPFIIEKSEKLPEIKEKLRHKIINSPYCFITKSPEILLMSENPDNFNFMVSFYCKNEEQALKIKELIA